MAPNRLSKESIVKSSDLEISWWTALEDPTGDWMVVTVRVLHSSPSNELLKQVHDHLEKLYNGGVRVGLLLDLYNIENVEPGVLLKQVSLDNSLKGQVTKIRKVQILVGPWGNTFFKLYRSMTSTPAIPMEFREKKSKQDEREIWDWIWTPSP